jgi:nucleotide-binding universal stress UspA family protein
MEGRRPAKQVIVDAIDRFSCGVTKMKVLIAYDGSDCAEAALDDLRKAGLPRKGVEALVLSVAEVWLPPPPPSSLEIIEAAREATSPAQLQKAYAKGSAAVEAARVLADRAKERLQKNFPEWIVSAEATSGSPAWEVIMRADKWKPELVVVGSHGRNALGRFVLGSVSQKVVTEARSSVRVARGRVEVDESPVRILVGVDGSPDAVQAVRAVAARVWSENSEARVVVVDDPLVPTLIGHLVPPVRKWVDEINETDRAWVQKVADAAASELREAGLKVESIIKEGDPKRVLVADAEEWGADCIFVGSTGFSNRLERFMLGSVSAAVTARAHCSVEVVRTAKD